MSVRVSFECRGLNAGASASASASAGEKASANAHASVSVTKSLNVSLTSRMEYIGRKTTCEHVCTATGDGGLNARACRSKSKSVVLPHALSC